MSEAGAVEGIPVASARFRASAGTLYVVATPLGNLRDVTLRALDILGTVDVIAAEDTRVTARLLARYGIAARVVSLHAHNEAGRSADVLARLSRGESVALVSDAGTPAVSDPGARLVRAVRDAGQAVVPIPGPSAVTTAISAAGLAAESFVFVGFLPAQGKERRARLAAVASLPAALVFYEAPHRIRATVDELAQVLGATRRLVVARELTKAFESIVTMALGEAAAWLAADANRERGEFVLIVDGPGEANGDETASRIDAECSRWLPALLAELPPSRAARVVAAVTGASRGDVYRRALELGAGGAARADE